MIGVTFVRRAARALARHWRLAPALVLLLCGGGLLGEQLWLAAKGRAAGVLIEHAFTAHLADGRPHRPWPWADTAPLARLEVPRLGIERIVLSGASGASLAFGPGHIDGTARPGSFGNIALAGHRDSWFAFLRDLRPGDEIHLVTRTGLERFRVASLEVRDMHDGAVLAPSVAERLTLITCYPFGGLVRGPQRYVVTCLKISDKVRRWVS